MKPLAASLIWLLFLSFPLSAAEPAPQFARPWKRHIMDGSSQGADGIRLSDANGDGLPDMVTGWEQGGAVRICFHPGHDRVRDKWPSVTVGTTRDVEDAVLVDLDGDGQMDVVSCAEGKTRDVVVHWAPRERGQLLDASAWQSESLPAAQQKMMWMFSLPLQVDGQHGIDLVAGGKGPNAALGWFQAPADARRLSGWKWHELRPLGWLMSLLAADMDGDGDADILFSDRKGQRSGAFWLENPGAAGIDRKPWREHAIGGTGAEVMFLQQGDLDRDGLEDVLLAVRPDHLLWCRRLDRAGTRWEPHKIALPAAAGTAKAVHVADVDADGTLDLLFSCENARAPKQGLMWLRRSKTLPTDDWQAQPLSGVDGVKHDLLAVLDLDGDGDLDVATTEEVKNFGVIWYENPLRQPKH
jgi:hypothetical protein